MPGTINPLIFNGKIDGQSIKLDDNEMRYLAAFVLSIFNEHSYDNMVLERATMVAFYKQHVKKLAIPKAGKIKLMPHFAIALHRLLKNEPINDVHLSILRQAVMDKIYEHYHFLL